MLSPQVTEEIFEVTLVPQIQEYVVEVFSVRPLESEGKVKRWWRWGQSFFRSAGNNALWSSRRCAEKIVEVGRLVPQEPVHTLRFGADGGEQRGFSPPTE